MDLPERQRKTAFRVASIPVDEFDAAIDSDDPATVTELAERLGVPQTTVSDWVTKMEQRSEIVSPPASRQHFDVWQFATADKDAGQQSYFGALPPQVMENLLWFNTEPGDVVVDLFAGRTRACSVFRILTKNRVK